MEQPRDQRPPLVEYAELAAALRQFAADRDWEQFHSPKNLVIALTGEVGELAEVFQWVTEEASTCAARDPRTAEAVRHELADVLLYVVRAADILGVDLKRGTVSSFTRPRYTVPAGDLPPMHLPNPLICEEA